MNPHPSQQGVALLTVLLVVFLATVAATGLATVQQFALRRSTLLLHQQQALYYARGAEAWALQILRQDERDFDHEDEDWAQHVPVVPVDGGGISGGIEDMQGRFNLNNLSLDPEPDPANPGVAVERPQEEALIRLLESLDLEAPAAEAIARQVRDWVDANPDPRFPGGAETADYLAQDPPYPSADRPLTSVTELRLLKDLDAETYAKLLPYVNALPLEGNQATPINVNTAEPGVLAAVLDSEPLTVSNCLDTQRPVEDETGLTDLLSCAGLAPDDPRTGRVGIRSRYFVVRVEAYVGDGRALLTSILHRGENDPLHVFRRSLTQQEP